MLSEWGTILDEMNNARDDVEGGDHASGVVDLEVANWWNT